VDLGLRCNGEGYHHQQIRAELFAAAEYYLHLGEVEGNLTASKSEPGHVPQI
jgi:hypothetical protein